MPREELRALQSQRLAALVRRVYEHVPFYRQRMDAHGVTPASVQSLDDLPLLPFTRKQDLRDNYPFGLLAVPREQVARIQASSGTRGKLTVAAYTHDDISDWAECCARAIALAGGRPGDVLQCAYGYGLFTGGLGLHYGGERFGATVIPMSGGNTLRQVMMLRDLQSHILCCTPSYALIIGEILEKEGLTTADIALRVGIFGAEPWTEEMRTEIEARLGLRATDIYGLTEVVGPGVANECCVARNGLHIAEDFFLAEVIDPETGAPVPDGTYGELVFTTLTKQAMPVVRYRTGDISAILPGECICGRTTRRMARLRGRYDDMLILHGVNVYPSEIEATLLGFEEIAPFYQIVLDWNGRTETIAVQAEMTSAYAVDAVDADVRMLSEQIARLLKSRFDLTMQVSLHQPGELGRVEVGKAVRVIDRRRSG
ncbi:MAG: phenylacetate--CoA ligase [Chloroflexi bacterium]|nr:MAG: phenylacetate--CoA ligase [Chloroflexota bacterium]